MEWHGKFQFGKNVSVTELFDNVDVFAVKSAEACGSDILAENAFSGADVDVVDLGTGVELICLS